MKLRPDDNIQAIWNVAKILFITLFIIVLSAYMIGRIRGWI